MTRTPEIDAFAADLMFARDQNMVTPQTQE